MTLIPYHHWLKAPKNVILANLIGLPTGALRYISSTSGGDWSWFLETKHYKLVIYWILAPTLQELATDEWEPALEIRI